MAQNGFGLRREIKTTEFAGIVKAHLASVIQSQNHMVMVGAGRIGGGNFNPPGHPQMNDQTGPWPEMKHNKLRTAMNGGDGSVADLGLKGLRRELMDSSGPVDPGMVEGCAGQSGGDQVIDHSLDFRQFGHKEIFSGRC
jgi:hypothetical protein